MPLEPIGGNEYRIVTKKDPWKRKQQKPDGCLSFAQYILIIFVAIVALRFLETFHYLSQFNNEIGAIWNSLVSAH